MSNTATSLVTRFLAATERVTPEVMATFLRRTSPTTPTDLVVAPPTADATALIRDNGWAMAAQIAAATDDPEHLASLAKHSSKQVRRAVAGNPNLPEGSVTYLWSWAVSHDDDETLERLAGRVPFGTLLEVIPPSGEYLDRSYAGRRHSSRWFLSQAALDRLRSGPDRSVENLRAALVHANSDFATVASSLCLNGQMPGLRFADTLSVDGVSPNRARGFVHHALTAATHARIDFELASCAIDHRDGLRELSPFGDRSVLGSNAPNLASRLDDDARDLLLVSGVRSFVVAAAGAADRDQAQGLLDRGDAAYAHRLLDAAFGVLSPAQVNQAVQQLFDHSATEDAIVPPTRVLDAKDGYVLDEHLLFWTVRLHGVWIGFVNGKLGQVPAPGQVTRLLAQPELLKVRNRYSRCSTAPADPVAAMQAALIENIEKWWHQPWADEIIDVFGGDLLHHATRNATVAHLVFGTLADAFGDHAQLWDGMLNIVDGWERPLPELIDATWKLFGRGIDRTPAPDPDDEPGADATQPQLFAL